MNRDILQIHQKSGLNLFFWKMNAQNLILFQLTPSYINNSAVSNLTSSLFFQVHQVSLCFLFLRA